MSFEKGDDVRVVKHRWKGHPNIPIGYIGVVERVRTENYILPIDVWFDIGDDAGIIASFEPEDLEIR